MELRFWAATDTGRVRDHNEDNFLVDQNLQLFVVCDGMGGHAAGEVASAVCVRTVREVIAAQSELLAHIRENPTDEVANESLKQLLRTAVQSANSRIFEMAKQDPSRRGMGTTCVALVLAGKRGFVGHVGDSRMYRIRKGKVEQVTDDHSLLNEMIRQGKVAPGTSESEFPHKNAVTRAVGVREAVDVDAFTIGVEPGDRLLMCSDGLNEYFDDSVDLLEMLGDGEPEETATRCIGFANQSGGKDNITVIVVDSEPEAVAKGEGAPERAEVIEILRKTAYFHYLMPPELEQIRKMATRIERDADELVMGEGENTDKMFLILKGSVSLQLDGEQVSVLTTGEHFGEMALIDAQNEQDTSMVAQSLEPSIFLAIERDQFVALLRTAPGLAIKLLWNFVQVFADRLQSVPPEYRFTPDEWRGDPDAIADVTPPAGTLVFEEDLERGQDNSGAAAISEVEEDIPPLPPTASASASSGGLEVSAGVTASHDELGDAAWSEGKQESAADSAPPELPEDMRKTMGLKDIDLDRLQEERSNSSNTIPSVSSDSETSSPDKGPPSVEFNHRRPDSSPVSEPDPTPGVDEPSARQQGAAADSGAEESPSVSFNQRSSESVPAVPPTPGEEPTAGTASGAQETADGGRAAGGREDGLRATVQLDWDVDTEQSRKLPPKEDRKREQANSAARQGTEDEPTEEWSADPARLKALRPDSSPKSGSGSAAAGVLKKAKGSSGQNTGAGGPINGSGEVDKVGSESEDSRQTDKSPPPSQEQKVMVSPDLIADRDEES